MDVQRLQESLEVKGDVAYTCETAGHFFLYQVLSRWEQFQSIVKPKSGKVPNAFQPTITIKNNRNFF